METHTLLVKCSVAFSGKKNEDSHTLLPNNLIPKYIQRNSFTCILRHMYKKNCRNGQNIGYKVNVNKEENKLKITVCSHVAYYRAVKINIL